MNLCPSTTLHEPSISLASPRQVFESTDFSGKWCIFRNQEAIDSSWIHVVALVATGALLAAKVSTRMSVALGGYDRHVICGTRGTGGTRPKCSRLVRCCVARDSRSVLATSGTAIPSPVLNDSSTKAEERDVVVHVVEAGRRLGRRGRWPPPARAARARGAARRAAAAFVVVAAARAAHALAAAQHLHLGRRGCRWCTSRCRPCRCTCGCAGCLRRRPGRPFLRYSPAISASRP